VMLEVRQARTRVRRQTAHERGLGDFRQLRLVEDDR
jgi:hypothetical protein